MTKGELQMIINQIIGLSILAVILLLLIITTPQR